MNVKASIGYVLLLVAVASLLLGVGSLSREAHGTGIALVALGAPALGFAWHTLRTSAPVPKTTDGEE